MVFSLVDGNYEVNARNDVRCHINFGEGQRAIKIGAQNDMFV